MLLGTFILLPVFFFFLVIQRQPMYHGPEQAGIPWDQRILRKKGIFIFILAFGLHMWIFGKAFQIRHSLTMAYVVISLYPAQDVEAEVSHGLCS